MTDNKSNFQRFWAIASCAAIQTSSDWPMGSEVKESGLSSCAGWASLARWSRKRTVCVGVRGFAKRCEANASSLAATPCLHRAPDLDPTAPSADRVPNVSGFFFVLVEFDAGLRTKEPLMEGKA